MKKIGGKLKKWMRSRKFWKRFAMIFVIAPMLLFSVLVVILYAKQDEIVQSLMKDLNEDFRGSAEIKGSHISLFENFPYISIMFRPFILKY